MQRYVIVRLIQAIFTLWALSLAVFLSVHLTGDPGEHLLGPEGTKADYEQLKKNLGLDKPLPLQYWLFVKNLARGDFGKSWMTGRPARDMLLDRLPATLQLAGAAILLTIGVGVPLGILSAVKRDSFLDMFGKFFAVLGIAVPSFWIAILLVLVFGAILGVLPTYGRDGPSHFILPACNLQARPEKCHDPGAHLRRTDPGRAAQRFCGCRAGIRLARHRQIDAPGHSAARLPNGASHGFGGRVLLHCLRLDRGHPLRLRKP